jgi:hypothetical protein
MKSVIERIHHIQNVVKEAEKEVRKGSNVRTYTIKGWKDSFLVKPIIRLHVDYLMFRIENSRTFRQQLGYLKSNLELPKDFFKDPESTEVQMVQEEILLNLITSSASGQSFLDDLEVRGQDDPAIITFEGYIVNGNRRTAALKNIGKEYIDCVVLPEDATKKDIYSLEHLLQISEDFKEDYHWVNELNNFYQGIHDQSLNFDKDQMAKSFRIKKGELESKLRTMDLIDEYLSWKGIPKQYDYEKLDYAEEIFRQLEKATRKIKIEQDRQELMHAVFVLLESPPQVGRLYSHVTSLIRDWELVYERIQSGIQQYPEDIADGQTKVVTSQENSFLNEIEEMVNPTEVFFDSNESEEFSKKIMEAVADIKAEKKEVSEAEAVYEGVSSALRDLQGLVIDDSSTKLEATKNKLEQIMKVAKILLDEIALVIESE